MSAVPNGYRKKRHKRRDLDLSRSRILPSEDPQEGDAFLDFSDSSSDNDLHFRRSYEDADRKQNGSCTRTEKQLSVFIIVCLVVVALMSVFLFLQQLQINKLNEMDLSIKPCDDFYEYACARGLRDPEAAPPDHSKWNTFSKIDKRNKALLKRLLDDLNGTYKGENSSAMMKVRNRYNSCMNISQRESISNDPLLEAIKFAGSWPILNNSVSGIWSEETWEFETSLAAIHSYSSSAILNFFVSVDDKDSSATILKFDQGGTMFSDYHAYSGNETQKYHDAFVTLFTKVLALLGGDKTIATDAAESIWELETKISEIQIKPENRTDPSATYSKVPLSKIQALLEDSLDLAELLELLFEQKIPMDTMVILEAPDYYEKLPELLKSVDKGTLATYITWRYAETLLSLMPTPFRLLLMELTTTLTGIQSSLPLWEQCVDSASDAAGFAVAALYVQATFSRDDKKRVEQVIDAIRKAFESNLPSLKWMDPVTRQKAQEKAKAVVEKIGYPDFIEDPDKLDKYYEKLNVTENDNFGNALAVRRFYVQDSISKLSKPVQKSEWAMFPHKVNAYYSPSFNQIVFPAGILQRPFYDKLFPQAVMYGAIGMVMGHELTHGFDNKGAHYDKDGNLNNWWKNESAEAFEEKSQCLVKQYNEFQVYSKHLNGLTTLGENIADNGGLKLAYIAYEDTHDSEEINLPGLNMTHHQAFFLSYAQMWCAFYTPQFAELSVVTDPHSYAKYRVIGVLRNSPKFSEAYSCPAGSPMNPEEKCTLW